jgi:hypothetical protein
MSQDNGIYVLVTESDNGPEYRVKTASAIGNIYGEWNDENGKYDGNLDAIKNVFAEAPVFYTLNEALDYAEQEEYDVGTTEDGICVINEFKDYGYIFG